jgi:hypothetical protein
MKNILKMNANLFNLVINRYKYRYKRAKNDGLTSEVSSHHPSDALLVHADP